MGRMHEENSWWMGVNLWRKYDRRAFPRRFHSLFTSQDKKVRARMHVELLPGNQVVLKVEFDGQYRTVHLHANDYAEDQSTLVTFTERLASKLTATIFAPIFRPNKEYPNLCQSPVATSTIICNYLSVCFLHTTNICLTHKQITFKNIPV